MAEEEGVSQGFHDALSLSLSLIFPFLVHLKGFFGFLPTGTVEDDSNESEASQGREHHRRSGGRGHRGHHQREPAASAAAAAAGDEGTVVVRVQVSGCEHG